MASELQILIDITMMLVVASVCTVVLGKLKMPTIIGYLLAGVLLGPYVLTEYVISEDIIDIFSMMGIVLLMFFIGIELNLRGLRKVASLTLLIAAGEMTLMILIGYSLAVAFGLTPSQAIFIGIIMSIASTAAVLTIMPNNKYLTNSERRAITGILVMEDIILVVVIAFAAPVLSDAGSSIISLLEMIAIIVLFMAISILLGIAVIPRILDWVNTRFSAEILFLVALALAFGMALISNMIGLSVAVGAFLMGIIVSQSVCSSKVCSRVEPMKELFIATFFISIGAQFDPRLFAQGALFAVAMAAVFILGKLFFISSASYLANFNARSCLYIAASLVAMGEFSFIVAKIALDGGLIDEYIFSSVIGAAFLTLILIPFISRGAPRLFDGLKRTFPKNVRDDMEKGGVRGLPAKVVARPEQRKEARKEIFLIIIDLVLIACVMIAVNILAVLDEFVGEIGSEFGVVPSLVAFFIGLMLTLPLIFILVIRLKKLSFILASMVINTNRRNRRRSAAGRVFKDLGEAFLAILLFLLFLPFLPPVEGMTFLPLIGLGLLASLLTYLFWDAYKAAYRRVTSSIVRGLSDKDEEVDEE